MARPTFSSSSILTVASALRSDGASASLCFGTDKAPIQDGQCQIYAVRFSGEDGDGDGGDAWAVRIPVYESLPPASITSIVQDEVDVMRKLNDAGFRWSPKLVGSDSGFSNPIGHPYLVMNWVPGDALQWTATVPAVENRHKILRQLVQILLELVECTQESRPGTSTQKYFTDIIDGQIARVLTGKLPELDLRSCFVHRALVRHVFPDETTSFAVSHGNLAAHKIIIDHDYNIKGIIGWSLARTRPLRMALRFPSLLSPGPDVTDPSSSAAPPPSVLVDRQFFVPYLSSLVSDQASQAEVSFAPVMNAIVSNTDVDWKDLVIDSCFSKGLHSWMETKSWLLDAAHKDFPALSCLSSGETLNQEIDEFLLGADEGIKKDFTRERLIEVSMA